MHNSKLREAIPYYKLALIKNLQNTCQCAVPDATFNMLDTICLKLHSKINKSESTGLDKWTLQRKFLTAINEITGTFYISLNIF